MPYLLFANNSEIEAAGLNALNLCNLESEAALFRVGGFKKQSILLKDHRPEVVRYTRRMLLESQPVSGFTPLFNTPAYLKIWLEESGRLLAEVFPPAAGPARFTLWISTAAGPEFPRFRYRLFQQEAQENGLPALFCIYKQPQLALRFAPALADARERAAPALS